MAAEKAYLTQQLEAYYLNSKQKKESEQQLIGLNLITGKDSRGLGWYCLFVAVLVPFPAYQTFMAGDFRLGTIWVLWWILWFLFWVMLALGKTSIAKWVKWYQLFILIFTLWIPGIIMLMGLW